MQQEMERWRNTFRRYIAPVMSRTALAALAKGLETDDPALVQGLTADAEYDPTAIRAHQLCKGGCAIGYGLWKAESLRKVYQVENAFAFCTHAAQERGASPADISSFTHWFDDGDRAEVFAQLLDEVNLALVEG
jgi:hypothetical protein